MDAVPGVFFSSGTSWMDVSTQVILTHGFLTIVVKWLLAAWILRSEPVAMVLIQGPGSGRRPPPAPVHWGPSGTTQLLRGNCLCRGPWRGTSRGTLLSERPRHRCVSLQKHKTVFASTLGSLSLALCHLVPTPDVISPLTVLLSLSLLVAAGAHIKSLSSDLPPLSGHVVQQRPTDVTSLWPASVTTLKDRNEAAASF